MSGRADEFRLKAEELESIPERPVEVISHATLQLLKQHSMPDDRPIPSTQRQRWARKCPELFMSLPALRADRWYAVLDRNPEEKGPDALARPGYVWLDLDGKPGHVWAAHLEIREESHSERRINDENCRLAGARRGRMRTRRSDLVGRAFTVRGPNHTPRSAGAGRGRSLKRRPSPPLGGGAQESPAAPTVLIVDDDELVRSILARMLKEKGCRVLTAATAEEALELYGREPRVHVVLADVVMPRVTGLELADRLRAIKPEQHIVLVSGYARDVLAKRGVTLPQLPFIQKPLSSDELWSKISPLLA
jgi:CheY-like chemotaxis protein